MPAGYGKLSKQRLHQLMALARCLPSENERVFALLENHCGSCAHLFLKGLSWASYYENTHQRHVSLFLTMAKLGDRIVDLAQSADPESELPKAMLPGLGPEFGMDEHRAREILGLYIGLSHSMVSARYFGRTMNGLVEAISAGQDAGLLLSAKVDRTAPAAQPMLLRLSRAQLEGDTGLFGRLKTAIGGKLGKPVWDDPAVAYLLAILDEDGSLERLSPEEIWDLIVEELSLWPSIDYAAKESLAKDVERWRAKVGKLLAG